MGLKIDHIVDAVKPLFRLPFSPLVLLALAAQRSPPLLESLTALRHKPNAEALKIIFGQLKTAVRGNVWLKVFAVIAGAKAINAAGNKIWIDRQSPRKIVWKNHIVVLTGGARGIGGGVASRLAARGAKVVVIDMLPNSDHGSETLYINADVTDEAALIAARQEVHKKLGKVTMVISCAGIARHAMVLDDPEIFPSEYQTKTHRVNMDGTYQFVKVFSQDMLGPVTPGKGRIEGARPVNGWGGHILMIGSGAAFSPLPANASYNMSKAAVLSLHHTLGWELSVFHKATSVRNSVICPLMVHSAMTKDRMLEQKNQFLLPTLTIDQVADRMVRILEEDRSQIVHMPKAAYVVATVNPNLPPWLVRCLYTTLGAHETFVNWARQNRKVVPDH